MFKRLATLIALSAFLSGCAHKDLTAQCQFDSLGLDWMALVHDCGPLRPVNL